jgi:hypothetical protein
VPVSTLHTVDCSLMMAAEMELLVFGDQTHDVQSLFRDLTQQRDNPVLEDFLGKSYAVLRREIYKLPSEVRNDLPRFTCIDDIIFRKSGGRRCVPLDMAITTMYQLGSFIR